MTNVKQAHIDDVADFWSRQGIKGDVVAKRLVLKTLLVGMALGRESEDWCRGFGLSRGEMAVLSALRRAPDAALRPTDLFVLLSTSSAGTTKQLDGLERLALVTRKPDPQRKRGFLVRLTAAGRAMADASHTGIDQAGPVSAALASLPEDQRAILEQAMDVLLKAGRDGALSRKSRAKKMGEAEE